MNIRKLTLCFFLSSAMNLLAQYEFHQPSGYTAKTYQKLIVKVGNQQQPYTQKMMKMIQDNWSLCPIVFYSDKFDKSWLVEGNLFLNFERYTIASQYVRDYGNNGGISNGQVNYNDYYYLDFWVIDKKYKPKNDWWDYKNTVARSEFYLRTIGMGDEEYKMFKIDPADISGVRESVYSVQREELYPKAFDFTGQFFSGQYLNGTEGQIKNMIQYVNTQLAKGSEKDFFESEKKSDELAQLKTQTLYVPNYWYGASGTICQNLPSGEKYLEITQKYITNLLKAYPYKIELIDREALNQKILSATEDFYYLNYIQSSADKIISVINGKTGDVIYSEVNKNAYRIKEKDLEKIGKQIK